MSGGELTIGVEAGAEPQRVTRPLPILGLALDTRMVAAVLGAFLVTRLLIVLIIFLSSAAMPMAGGDYGYARPDNLALDGLVRHDSWWYVNIIEHGYVIGDRATGQQGTVTFFPLYPLLVKLVAVVTGDVFSAGVLVSNLAFLVALFFCYGVARHEFGDEVAGRAVFYLAAAPTGVFFSAMYTESVFTLFVCATFFFAQRRMWLGAALAGALAAATRNTGVLMAAVIALEGLSQQGVRFVPSLALALRPRSWLKHLARQIRPAMASWPAMLAAAYVLVGLAAYMVFLQLTFGDPLAFIHAQATWGRTAAGNGLTKILGNIITNLNIGPSPLAGQISPLTVMNLLATLGFAPLVLVAALRLRSPFAVYSVLTLYIPLSTGSIGSMARYSLMLVPCFLLLAVWGRRVWVDRLVLGIFLPLTAYFAIMFSHWYFVG